LPGNCENLINTIYTIDELHHILSFDERNIEQR
jgi:hypothetical protein